MKLSKARPCIIQTWLDGKHFFGSLYPNIYVLLSHLLILLRCENNLDSYRRKEKLNSGCLNFFFLLANLLKLFISYGLKKLFAESILCRLLLIITLVCAHWSQWPHELIVLCLIVYFYLHRMMRTYPTFFWIVHVTLLLAIIQLCH